MLHVADVFKIIKDFDRWKVLAKPWRIPKGLERHWNQFVKHLSQSRWVLEYAKCIEKLSVTCEMSQSCNRMLFSSWCRKILAETSRVVEKKSIRKRVTSKSKKIVLCESVSPDMFEG